MFPFKMNFATCIIDSTFPNIPNIVLGERKYKWREDIGQCLEKAHTSFSL